MTKVFLVEDEYVVREGIKKNIAWAENGFEFCGEASDGELALPLIEKFVPDIVITDIKMPFMDGLELSRLIRNEFPEMEIVFLTGYAEFEYAKEAIKLGVAEYLSKPVSGTELLKVLTEIKRRVEDKRQEKEMRLQYLREMTENTEKEKNELLLELVSGEKHTAELVMWARDLGIELTAPWYSILLLKLKSKYHEQDEYSKSVIARFDEIEALCINDNPLFFDRSPEGKAYIFKADSKEELETNVDTFIKEVRSRLDTHSHIQYFGGVGDSVNRLGELPACFESASRAFALRYLVDGNHILLAKNINENELLNRQDVMEDGIEIPQRLDQAKFLEFLKMGEARDARFFVEEFFSGIGNNAIKSQLMRQYVAVDSYLKVMEFIKSVGGETSDVEQVTENKETLASEEGAREYLVRLIDTAISAREQVSKNRYGEVIKEITKYIDDNFQDDELNLNMIAQYMNFSPNHLSMIFSQETGQTFIKYLTDIRIKKAKELLKCTSKRSNEICEEVGYKDPHYFSYLFKKNVGMSPTEYRER